VPRKTHAADGLAWMLVNVQRCGRLAGELCHRFIEPAPCIGVCHYASSLACGHTQAPRGKWAR